MNVTESTIGAMFFRVSLIGSFGQATADIRSPFIFDGINFDNLDVGGWLRRDPISNHAAQGEGLHCTGQTAVTSRC